MKIISAIADALKIMLCIFLLAVLGFFIALFYGISIEKLEFMDFSAQKLYMKLDDKLILRARVISYSPAPLSPQTPQNAGDLAGRPERAHEQAQGSRVQGTDGAPGATDGATGGTGATDDGAVLSRLQHINELRKVFWLFKEISITELNIGQHALSAQFDGSNLHISSAEFSLRACTDGADAMPVELKTRANVSFSGKISPRSKELAGELIYKAARARVHASEAKNRQKIILEDIFIPSNAELAAEISQLPPAAAEWLLKRLKMQKITGKVTLELKKYALKSLRADFNIAALEAQFHDQIPAALAQNVAVSARGKNILIAIKNARSGEILADDLRLFIKDFSNPLFELKITSKSLFGHDLAHLVNVYGANVPLRQSAGNAETTVRVDFGRKRPARVRVDSALAGQLALGDLPLDASAAITVDTANAAQMAHFSGEANISSAPAAEQGASGEGAQTAEQAAEQGADGAGATLAGARPVAEVSETPAGVLNLGKFDGVLNSSHQLKITFTSAQISAGVFGYSGALNFSADLARKTFALPELFARGSYQSSGEITAEIGANILQFLPALRPFNPLASEIILRAGGGAEAHILADVSYELAGRVEDKFKVYLSSEPRVFGKHLNYAAGVLNLKRLNLDLPRLLALKDEQKSSQSLNGLKIYLSDCLGLYDGKKMPLNGLWIELGSAAGEGATRISKSDGSVLIYSDAEQFYGHIYHLAASKFNDFIGSKIFEGGELAAEFSGKSPEDFSALINVIDANLAQTKTYARLLKTLDSLGTIARLKADNSEVLHVKIGSIELERLGSIINFSRVQMLGQHLDASGGGFYDLAGENLFLRLNLITLKNTSKTLQSLPIINKILLGGKNQGLGTTLVVKGPLNEPKFSTSVASDVLITPLRLIENVIKLPKNLLEN